MRDLIVTDRPEDEVGRAFRGIGDGERLEGGVVQLATNDHHLRLAPGHRLRYSEQPREAIHRQDEASSAVYGMPHAAAELGAARQVCRLEKSATLSRASSRARTESRAPRKPIV